VDLAKPGTSKQKGTNDMGWLKNLLSKLVNWSHTPKVQEAEATVATLMPYAMAIAGDINTLAPNKTLTEFNTITTKYALPAVTDLSHGVNPGQIALNLGGQILAKNHAPAAAQMLLDTTMQLAAFALAPPATVPVTDASGTPVPAVPVTA
jgi:hypothetical protein